MIAAIINVETKQLRIFNNEIEQQFIFKKLENKTNNILVFVKQETIIYLKQELDYEILDYRKT